MTSDENARYTDIHPPEPGGESAPNDVDTSPGQLLARRREALGLSLQQVADDLHLTMHYVRALEADAHDKLPGVVFIRGYIRAYASYLKLDPTVLVNVFNEFINQRDSTVLEANYSISRHRRDRNRPWIVISGIAFVAIAVALWYFGTGAGAPTATSTPTPGTTTATAASDPATLDSAASRRAAAVSSSSVTPPAVSTATPAPAVVSSGFTAQVPTAPSPVVDNVPVSSSDAVSAAAPSATPAVVQAAAATPTAPAATAAPVATPAPTGTATPAATASPAASATPAQAAQATAAVAPQAATPSTPSEQRVSPTQVITVDAGGSDLVEILFSGESLVQIDDGSARQIYRDIRAAGDHLRVSGTGPFNVLLGDAATAELHLNGKKIDFTQSIRIDNSARLTIGL